METITAKEYLSRAFRIDQRISSKLEQVQSLRSLAEKAGTTLTGAPKGRGGNHQSMEETITKMVDLEADINNDLKQLMDTKIEIITVIKCVEVLDLQLLLEMRYLNFNQWEEIAEALGCRLRNVFKLHGKALSEVETIRRI